MTTFFQRQAIDVPDSITTADILFLFFVARHNLPANVSDNFTDQDPRLFPDSVIAKDFRCKRTRTTLGTDSDGYRDKAMSRRTINLCHDWLDHGWKYIIKNSWGLFCIHKMIVVWFVMVTVVRLAAKFCQEVDCELLREEFDDLQLLEDDIISIVNDVRPRRFDHIVYSLVKVIHR